MNESYKNSSLVRKHSNIIKYDNIFNTFDAFKKSTKPIKGFHGDIGASLRKINFPEIQHQAEMFEQYEKTKREAYSLRAEQQQQKVLRAHKKVNLEEFEKFENLDEKINKELEEQKKEEELKKQLELQKQEELEEEINNNRNNEIIPLDDLKEPMTTVDSMDISAKSKNVPFLKELYISGCSPSNNAIKGKYIYALNRVNRFSFFYGQKDLGYTGKGKKKALAAPAPVYIENDLWDKPVSLLKKDVFKGIAISNEVGLKFTDKNLSKKFSGMVLDLIGQVLKVPFGHKISLNVRLFEPRCLTSRFPELWCNLSNYVHPAAAREMSPLERMKNVMTFAISGLYCYTQQLKPFNPIIGETYQGELQNDLKTKVYVEQITTKPVCSRFYVVDSLCTLTGFFDLFPTTELLKNRIVIDWKGKVKVNFKDIDESIEYSMPNPHVVNFKDENNRGGYYHGCFVFADVKNGLKGIVKIGHRKEVIHQVDGIIMKWIYPKNYKFSYDVENKWGLNFQFNQKKLKVESILKGSWLYRLSFDNKEYWDIDKVIPCWLKPLRNALPSDGRFREELIWLYRSFYGAKNEKERIEFENYAQSWKVNAEKLNRKERAIKQKTRENFYKKYGKRKK